jgi:gamma-D-glutamyl-L-lysine dipeptidyl-peptidase
MGRIRWRRQAAERRANAWAPVLSVLLLGLIAGCGGSPVARQSPTPSEASASPTWTASPSSQPSPSPPAVRAGAPAWVLVSVASGWRTPQSPRAVDALALTNPARVREWIAGMTASDKSGLIGRLDSQLLLGDQVDVLELKTGWARVVVPDQSTPLDSRGYPVWIPLRQLTAVPPPEASELVMVKVATTWLSDAQGRLEMSYGTTLPVVRHDTSTYLVELPRGRTMSVPANAVSAPVVKPSGAGVVAAARRFLSLPYLWGGTSGFGYDCSGLVHLVYKANGIVLPRDADPQSRVGVAVSRASLQPGDLVFFSSGGVAYHVAIYSGGGYVIESPAPGKRVQEVRLNNLPEIADYAGARRVLPAAPPPTPSPRPSPTPTGVPISLAGAEWSRLPTSDKVVALTFDAGGNNAGVASITATLKSEGVPATFFLTGRWTEVYPADARKIASAYGIGNHTYSHPRLTDLTDAQVKDQVTHAASVVKTTTGRDPRPLFRFPYGSTNARVLADVHSLGYGGIRWTVDTLGWEGRNNGQSEATVLKRVLGALTPGEIILMHVGAANDGSTLDAAALPSIIRELKARGYRMVLIASYVR